MGFVLDCSVSMAWCFEDEGAGYADAVLGMLAQAEALVPMLWPLEVANVLLVAERRGRINAADATRFAELLRGLPIAVDGQAVDRALSDVLPLARSLSLSSYDAAYLDLAMREGVPLATLDQRLRQAALQIGVSILQPA